MYMDILEQEVEALSAEVTRLRLMVHRVTQVMEAPPPQRHSHIDPLAAPQTPLTGDGAPAANLQATVDSYKQILPLIQLLLEQQQQHQRKGQAAHSSTAHSKRGKRTSRRHHRRRRSRRTPSTSSSSYSASSSGTGSSSSSSSRSSSSHSVQAPSASASNHPRSAAQEETSQNAEHLHDAGSPATPASGSASNSAAHPARKTSPEMHHAAATGRRRQSVVSIEETPTRLVQHNYLTGTTPPTSGSVVDRLRAMDRRQAAEDDAEDSTDSSNIMPMATTQTRSAATSPSASAQRQHKDDTRPARLSSPPRSGTHHHAYPKGANVNASFSLVSQPKLSHSLVSSKLLEAPMASDVVPGIARSRVESIRSASIPPEDMGYYEFSPVVSVLDEQQQLPPPPSSQNVASDQSGHKPHDGGGSPASAAARRSSANSLEYSEQGRYSYSFLGSLANSPAASHVPDETARSARTGTATAQSVALDPPRSTTVVDRKQLPAQSSAVARAHNQPTSSTTTSSSDDDTSDGNVARTPIVLTPSATATANRPFGSGVVLGARQPISVQSPSKSAPSSAFPTAQRPSSAAAAGAAAAVPARTNLLSTLRSMQSSSTSNSSSSSSDGAGAAFRPQQMRQAVHQEDHRDSSFHHYSDGNSSPAGSHVFAPPPHKPMSQATFTPQSQQVPPPQQHHHPTVSPTMSPDAYSFGAYSAQHTPQMSPRPAQGVDIDASADLSRAVSHSMSRPQTARSESHAASSSPGHRGSIASGGYYYGYDAGMGSPSMQSFVSNGGVEHATTSSTPAYDY